MTSKPHYVIIGCGAAGSQAAYQIRESAPDAEITVFSREPYPVYYKYNLADYLFSTATEFQTGSNKLSTLYIDCCFFNALYSLSGTIHNKNCTIKVKN